MVPLWVVLPLLIPAAIAAVVVHCGVSVHDFLKWLRRMRYRHAHRLWEWRHPLEFRGRPRGNGVRVRALFVGLNYHTQRDMQPSDEKLRIQGSIEDVQRARAFAHNSLHIDTCNTNEFAMLTDDTFILPVRRTFFAAWRWLTFRAAPCDVLLSELSSHGKLVCIVRGDTSRNVGSVMPLDAIEDYSPKPKLPHARRSRHGKAAKKTPKKKEGGDADGDADRRDRHLITEDEIIAHMLLPLYRTGALLVATFDCCHSGSELQLAHIYEVRESVVVHSRNRRCADPRYADLMRNVRAVAISACRLDEEAAEVFVGADTNPPDVFDPSPCVDWLDETLAVLVDPRPTPAHDTAHAHTTEQEDSQPTPRSEPGSVIRGACTSAMYGDMARCRALDRLPCTTWRHLMVAIQAELDKSGCVQHVRVSSSQPLALDRPMFDMLRGNSPLLPALGSRSDKRSRTV